MQVFQETDYKMAKLNIDVFEKFINDAKESTAKAVASSPFLSKTGAKGSQGAVVLLPITNLVLFLILLTVEILEVTNLKLMMC